MTTQTLEDIRSTEIYKSMTHYIACSIAEGFADEPVTQEEAHAAWQYLVDTGLAWSLQGWYGRNAESMIEAGLLLPANS